MNQRNVLERSFRHTERYYIQRLEAFATRKENKHKKKQRKSKKSKEKKVSDIEENDSENQFIKFLNRIMEWCGFTSGVGIIAIGAYWFLYSMIQYIFLSPTNIMQQNIHENYFNQAQMGIVIVALGVLIRAVKGLKSE